MSSAECRRGFRPGRRYRRLGESCATNRPLQSFSVTDKPRPTPAAEPLLRSRFQQAQSAQKAEAFPQRALHRPPFVRRVGWWLRSSPSFPRAVVTRTLFTALTGGTEGREGRKQVRRLADGQVVSGGDGGDSVYLFQILSVS